MLGEFLTESILNNYPVIDGFTLRRDYRCNYTFLSLAVDQYERLRRAQNFKQKQWVFPRDPFADPVPAFGSSEKALRVGIGSVIWGYGLSGIVQPGQISGFQIRDTCTDEPLFSEPMTQQFSFWPGNVTGFNGPIGLPRLLVIGKPGIITIELMNIGSAPAPQQIVLYGGQPVGVDH